MTLRNMPALIAKFLSCFADHLEGKPSQETSFTFIRGYWNGRLICERNGEVVRLQRCLSLRLKRRTFLPIFQPIRFLLRTGRFIFHRLCLNWVCCLRSMSENPSHVLAEKLSGRFTEQWQETSSLPMPSSRNSKRLPNSARAWMKIPSRLLSMDDEYVRASNSLNSFWYLCQHR